MLALAKQARPSLLGIIGRFSMLADLYPSQELLTRKIGRIQESLYQ